MKTGDSKVIQYSPVEIPSMSTIYSDEVPVTRRSMIKEMPQVIHNHRRRDNQTVPYKQTPPRSFSIHSQSRHSHSDRRTEAIPDNMKRFPLPCDLHHMRLMPKLPEYELCLTMLLPSSQGGSLSLDVIPGATEHLLCPCWTMLGHTLVRAACVDDLLYLYHTTYSMADKVSLLVMACRLLRFTNHVLYKYNKERKSHDGCMDTDGTFLLSLAAALDKMYHSMGSTLSKSLQQDDDVAMNMINTTEPESLSNAYETIVLFAEETSLIGLQMEQNKDPLSCLVHLSRAVRCLLGMMTVWLLDMNNKNKVNVAMQTDPGMCGLLTRLAYDNGGLTDDAAIRQASVYMLDVHRYIKTMLSEQSAVSRDVQYLPIISNDDLRLLADDIVREWN